MRNYAFLELLVYKSYNDAAKGMDRMDLNFKQNFKVQKWNILTNDVSKFQIMNKH